MMDTSGGGVSRERVEASVGVGCSSVSATSGFSNLGTNSGTRQSQTVQPLCLSQRR